MATLAGVNEEDLKIDEAEVTSALLLAGSFHYGSYCKKQNDAFMKCRNEGRDPRKCLKQGHQVLVLNNSLLTLCAIIAGYLVCN